MEKVSDFTRNMILPAHRHDSNNKSICWYESKSLRPLEAWSKVTPELKLHLGAWSICMWDSWVWNLCSRFLHTQPTTRHPMLISGWPWTIQTTPPNINHHLNSSNVLHLQSMLKMLYLTSHKNASSSFPCTKAAQSSGHRVWYDFGFELLSTRLTEPFDPESGEQSAAKSLLLFCALWVRLWTSAVTLSSQRRRDIPWTWRDASFSPSFFDATGSAEHAVPCCHVKHFQMSEIDQILSRQPYTSRRLSQYFHCWTQLEEQLHK